MFSPAEFCSKWEFGCHCVIRDKAWPGDRKVFTFSSNLNISTGSCGSNSREIAPVEEKHYFFTHTHFYRGLIVPRVSMKNSSFHRGRFIALGCIFTKIKDLIYGQIAHIFNQSFIFRVGLNNTFSLMENRNTFWFWKRAFVQRVNKSHQQCSVLWFQYGAAAAKGPFWLCVANILQFLPHKPKPDNSFTSSLEVFDIVIWRK